MDNLGDICDYTTFTQYLHNIKPTTKTNIFKSELFSHWSLIPKCNSILSTNSPLCLFDTKILKLFLMVFEYICITSSYSKRCLSRSIMQK